MYYLRIDFLVGNSPFARDKKGGWVEIFTYLRQKVNKTITITNLLQKQI